MGILDSLLDAYTRSSIQGKGQGQYQGQPGLELPPSFNQAQQNPELNYENDERLLTPPEQPPPREPGIMGLLNSEQGQMALSKMMESGKQGQGLSAMNSPNMSQYAQMGGLMSMQGPQGQIQNRQPTQGRQLNPMLLNLLRM